MTAWRGARRTIGVVPEISRFLGIVIHMYHRDHGGPHFHAVYGEFWISVEVKSGAVRGNFPPRALRHVREWAGLHREDLLRDWDLAVQGRPLKQIPPLE